MHKSCLKNKIKIHAMKHLIRSIKYFFYFCFLTALIILVLVMIGAVEGDINAIFNEGYNSLWKIAILFAVVAAVYPKLGFISRKLETDADWDMVKEKAVEYFSTKPFKVESETGESISFRRRGAVARLLKMGEDRITVRKTDSGFLMEGIRKDVTLYAAGLEHMLPAPYGMDSEK